jgi:hypothetical protein
MKKESKTNEFQSAALLLHLTIFAYQKSYADMVGSGSKAILTLIIPYLSELIKNTGLPQLSKEKNIDENMLSYIVDLHIIIISYSKIVTYVRSRFLGLQSFIILPDHRYQ